MNETATPGMERPPPDFLKLPLHVETHGEEGPPVVLVHGFGANGFTWNRWLPQLTKTHRAVVVEMKGAGSSPKPRGAEYGPHEQALLLHRLILQQDLSEITLVGHSLGGGVALLAALRLLDESPGRLKRMVLIAPASYHQPIPYFIGLAARPILGSLMLRFLPKAFLMRQALKMAYHNRSLISASQIQAYAEPVRTPDGQHALSRMAQQIVPGDLDDFVARYPELKVPTLLMWGRQDRIVPLRFGEKLDEDLPHSHLEILEECGHIPHEEKPEESFKIFREFLKG
jgi:pimeloyl-ACP methyl ester carboxylesterase